MKSILHQQSGAAALQKILPTANKLISSLFALFLLAPISSTSAQAQKKPVGGPSQWLSVGGKRIFSCDHEFKNLWVVGSPRGKMPMYWKNAENRKSAASHAFDPEVLRDILVKKATIVVTGPGFIARDIRQGGATSFFIKRPDVHGWHAQDLGVSRKYTQNNNWTTNWKRISATAIDDIYKGWSGGIPEGETVTLEVWVSRPFITMAHVGRGYGTGFAGGDVWWFPKKGGKLVRVTPHGQSVVTPPDHPGHLDDPPAVHAGNKGLLPIADSQVYAYSYRNWNKANWGAYNVLGAGHHPLGGDKRSYLKFDVRQLNIPSGSSVKLRLYHYHTAGGHSIPLGIFRVTSPWKEGRGTYHSGSNERTADPGEISWMLQPSIDSQAVTRFNPGPGVNKYVEVDVTQLVKAWKSGQANHGMVIAPLKTEGGANRESVYGFRSREHQEIAQRPALIIGGSGGTNIPSPPPATGVLQVRADHKQVQQGQTFYVPVWLDFPKTFPRTREGRINAANLNVDISYNPNVLKAGTKIMPGNVLGGALFQSNPKQPGMIKLGFATKKGIYQSVTLAQLIFQAVGQPGQRSPISVRITQINDDQGRTPRTKVVHGYVSIVKQAVIGDINGNGIVDAGDALSALKMSVGITPQNMTLNVDKKDQVTSNDARLLLQMAVQGGGTLPASSTQPRTTPQPPAPQATPTPKPSSEPSSEPAGLPAQSAEARRAYQEYIAAYNRLTSLMAKGQGDTPAAKSAYAAYKVAKDKYEAAIKTQPPINYDE